MQRFEDSNDVEEWLETLDYERFWQETDPNGLNADERANCDISVTQGVDKAVILKCIKAAKRLEIIREQNLGTRDIHPPIILH
ncbi:MAG: hypothetical protein GY748_24340 [Planctomycetaceae bacterium]|nr:hypothetical protein [Planctomycetaceae bacterium]